MTDGGSPLLCIKLTWELANNHYWSTFTNSRCKAGIIDIKNHIEREDQRATGNHGARPSAFPRPSLKETHPQSGVCKCSSRLDFYIIFHLPSHHFHQREYAFTYLGQEIQNNSPSAFQKKSAGVIQQGWQHLWRTWIGMFWVETLLQTR